jgi:hypothetical protein
MVEHTNGTANGRGVKINKGGRVTYGMWKLGILEGEAMMIMEDGE